MIKTFNLNTCTINIYIMYVLTNASTCHNMIHKWHLIVIKNIRNICISKKKRLHVILLFINHTTIVLLLSEAMPSKYTLLSEEMTALTSKNMLSMIIKWKKKQQLYFAEHRHYFSNIFHWNNPIWMPNFNALLDRL